MMIVLKALCSTLFIAAVSGIFVASLIAVAALNLGADPALFWSVEGLGALCVLAFSCFFFVRAYRYERYGDAHRPAVITQ